MSVTLVEAQEPGKIRQLRQVAQRCLALGPGLEDFHQFGQLLAQLHDASAFGEFFLHVSAAQLGKARYESIGGEPVQLRLGKQITLHVPRAALQRKAQLRLGLHAFCNDPAAGFFRHLRQCPHDFTAGTTFCGFLKQEHVQLENVRLQRQYAVELRIAGAEVIDGDACAGLAIARHHVGQALDIAAQFSDLEHDALWVDAVGLHLLQAGQGLAGTQAIDPARRDVQAQKPVLRRLVQTAQGVVADLPIQTAQGHAWGAWVGEQRAHGQQAAVSLAQAAEGFDAGNAPGGGVNEWLEAGERLPVDHGASLKALARKGPALADEGRADSGCKNAASRPQPLREAPCMANLISGIKPAPSRTRRVRLLMLPPLAPLPVKKPISVTAATPHSGACLMPRLSCQLWRMLRILFRGAISCWDSWRISWRCISMRRRINALRISRREAVCGISVMLMAAGAPGRWPVLQGWHGTAWTHRISPPSSALRRTLRPGNRTRTG